MGLGKTLRVLGFTLDFLTTNCGFLSRTTEIYGCQIILAIANVSSRHNFALLFAAATAQTIKSYTLKKELQHVFKRMRSVFKYEMNLKLYHTTNFYS